MADKANKNELVVENLIVCGVDATPNQLAVGNIMAELGYGYVCRENELEEGVNEFIDRFMNDNVTFYFYGTIRTSKGIRKHPKHNLIGYDSTLKMGDNLGTNYVACISLTTGGIPFSTSVVISHNQTYIKGFTLEGNCEKNKNASGVYSYKGIYGGVISHEIYNKHTTPYTETQLASDIVIEDLTAINTMRGIIIGIGWVGKNLKIGDSVGDHGLYLAGADGCIVENVYLFGTHKKGTVAVSSSSWDSTRRVRNIRMRNITLDERNATDGPYLDIRGHFSSANNNQTLNDISIDGFFIKKQKVATSVVCVTIGTAGRAEVNSNYTLHNYPTNISIKNFVADVKLGNTFCIINNANVILEEPSIRLQDYRPDRPLFKLQSRDILKKSLVFRGLRVAFDCPPKSVPYTLFGIDNSLDTHNQINGLNINDLVVEGNANSYLFGIADVSGTKSATIKNLTAERIIAIYLVQYTRMQLAI